MPSPEHNFTEAQNVPVPEELALPLDNGPERETKEKIAEAKHASMFHKRLQTAKRAIQTAIIATEVNHLTNEGLRFGAFGATMAETHNPALGAAVLGGTTLAIEGAGALATASLLSADQRGRLLDWALNKGKKVVPRGKKIPPAGEFGVAMIAGTPVLMGLKNIADPERTLEQNRRHGLFTASWMATLFTAEGAILGNSVEKYNDPKMLAGGAIAIGGVALAIKLSKSLLKNSPEVKGLEESVSIIGPQEPENRPQVVEGQELNEEQIERSIKFYSDYRDDNDEGVRIGLYGEDLQKALRSSRSTLVKYEMETGKDYYTPLLVPLDELEWYNIELFKKIYGENTELYYYTRPPVPSDADSLMTIANLIKNKLDNGGIVVSDWYEPKFEDEVLAMLQNLEGSDVTLEDVNSGELQRKADVFAGPVIFADTTEIKESPSILEVYNKAVADGELENNLLNGVALMETIDGEEAERIWEVYEAPFEKLGEEDPTYAGFDKESLMAIMQNREVAKIVNRVEGKITSLCFFVEDFKNCPWFNPEYYEKNFPEYHNTNNILIFPGIVSDETMKGSSYSGLLIDLAVRLYAKRGSNVLVTFECTEVSTRYIPRIVTRAINSTGVGTISGLERPLSTIRYSVLKKSSAAA